MPLVEAKKGKEKGIYSFYLLIVHNLFFITLASLHLDHLITLLNLSLLKKKKEPYFTAKLLSLLKLKCYHLPSIIHLDLSNSLCAMKTFQQNILVALEKGCIIFQKVLSEDLSRGI